MDKVSIYKSVVDNMVAAADKVFKDEWGDYPEYDLWDAKDYFRTCMDVVEEIITFYFPELLPYFRSIEESKLNKYFGGKKSE